MHLLLDNTCVYMQNSQSTYSEKQIYEWPRLFSPSGLTIISIFLCSLSRVFNTTAATFVSVL